MQALHDTCQRALPFDTCKQGPVRLLQMPVTLLQMPFLASTFKSSTVTADFYGVHHTAAVMQAIPKPMYWLCFVIATAGALIGSQSLITSTFSIVRQAMHLNCFPPVKILHTGNIPKHQCASSQHSSHLDTVIPCNVWSICQLLSLPCPPPPPPLGFAHKQETQGSPSSPHCYTINYSASVPT